MDHSARRRRPCSPKQFVLEEPAIVHDAHRSIEATPLDLTLERIFREVSRD